MIFNLNYLVILIEAAISRKMSAEKNKNAWRIFIAITFIQLLLVASLRASSVGIDTGNYLKMFKDAQAGWMTNYIEFGSRWYIFWLGRLTQSNTLFLAAWAVPTVALFYRYIVRNSKDIYLSVCIYASLMYYFLLFNIIRQALAIGIVLQAVEPLKNKKYVRYGMIVLAAMLIHSSAVVFLLMLPISLVKVKPNISLCLLTTVLCAVFSCAGKALIVFGAGLAGYGGYLSTGFAGEGNILHPILFLLLLFVCSILLLCRSRDAVTSYRLEYDMFVVGALFYWLSISVQIVNRIPYYFTGSIMTLLPNLIVEMSNRRQASVVKLCAIVFLFGYEILMVARGAQGITPYHFFWN